MEIQLDFTLLWKAYRRKQENACHDQRASLGAKAFLTDLYQAHTLRLCQGHHASGSPYFPRRFVCSFPPRGLSAPDRVFPSSAFRINALRHLSQLSGQHKRHSNMAIETRASKRKVENAPNKGVLTLHADCGFACSSRISRNTTANMAPRTMTLVTVNSMQLQHFRLVQILRNEISRKRCRHRFLPGFLSASTAFSSWLADTSRTTVPSLHASSSSVSCSGASSSSASSSFDSSFGFSLRAFRLVAYVVQQHLHRLTHQDQNLEMPL